MSCICDRLCTMNLVTHLFIHHSHTRTLYLGTLVNVVHYIFFHLKAKGYIEKALFDFWRSEYASTVHVVNMYL